VKKSKVSKQPIAGARSDKVSTTKLPINPRAPMTGLERGIPNRCTRFASEATGESSTRQ
jgi:hypothetical protein